MSLPEIRQRRQDAFQRFEATCSDADLEALYQAEAEYQRSQQSDRVFFATSPEYWQAVAVAALLLGYVLRMGAEWLERVIR